MIFERRMIMRLTVENDYGFRIIEYLLENKGVIPASELSEELNIPLRFTLKILRKLNLYGLTKAKRGTNGGYYINRSIKDINYYDVIVATQGPIIINRCLDNPDNCNMGRSGNCSIHDQLSLIQENLIRDLKACKFY
ncbi:transcriptional regulator, Rrf2 family [Peptostreptococcaceae bacterium oral taxon 113 str. W5053]|nr:transcriptional regulator, Rrf2 family [Peptostreptococcaceae bacterium oral taxon 113 str. W5053]